jgi:hypothetical protein
MTAIVRCLVCRSISQPHKTARSKEQGATTQNTESNIQSTMKRATVLGSLLVFLWDSQLANSQDVLNNNTASYTFSDSASWAITSSKLSTLLGEDKQVLYDNYIKGCSEAAKSSANTMGMSCRRDEQYRMEMIRFQPQSVRNFTTAGYKKIRAPPELFKLIQSFYNQNKGRDEIEWANM